MTNSDFKKDEPQMVPILAVRLLVAELVNRVIEVGGQVERSKHREQVLQAALDRSTEERGKQIASAAIERLGGVGRPIRNDEEVVRLGLGVDICVNGRLYKYPDESLIWFETLVAIASCPPAIEASRDEFLRVIRRGVPTVTYNCAHRAGTLLPLESTLVVSGIVFNVVNTSAS